MSFDWLKTDVETAAKRLLGCEVIREFEDGTVAKLRIVEVEAYDQADPAAHSFRGQTPRTRAMFLSAGHLYVYFTYGMHYCANIVTGEAGVGSGVLIRALEPLEGWPTLRRHRPGLKDHQLTNGPAKLCKALQIDLNLYQHDLSTAPFYLVRKPALPEELITTTTRIGISKAKDAPRRFYISHNPYVSK